MSRTSKYLRAYLRGVKRYYSKKGWKEAQEGAYLTDLHDWQTNGKPKTALALWLEGLWDFIVTPHHYAFSHICTHKNMVDESVANGDTGYDEFYCPDCGFEFHHTYY